MHKFKIGDRVRCIRGTENKLVKSMEYTVLEVSEGREDYYIHVHKHEGGWSESRFELVKSEPTDEELAKNLRKYSENLKATKRLLETRGFRVEVMMNGGWKITKTITETIEL